MSIKTKTKLRSKNGIQTVILVTTEVLTRQTPNNLGEAIGNALTEHFGFLRTHRRPWLQSTIDTFLKHLKDRLAQDFQTALLKSKHPEEIKELFDKIFPPEKPGPVQAPKKVKLRSAG